MPFHHEKLIVYQRALQFASWSQDLIDSLTKKTSTRDQLERAGDSIALNIAEGNGKFSQKIARDSFRSHTAPLWSPQRASIFSWRDAAVEAMRLRGGRRFWRRS